jgi:hypothetical protein
MNWLKNLITKESEPIKEFTTEDFETVKFKARIALVDDEEILHVKRLQKEGYSIVDYSDIDNVDEFIRKKYNVVILDIQGIGRKIAGSSEGWGLLKYLKDECPHMVIIMFTGADWSITKYQDLAKQADLFIGKDLEYLDFKSKLDSAIRIAFSPKFHFELEKKNLLKNISNADSLRQIEEIIYKYGRDKKRALKEIRKISTNPSVIQSTDNLLSIINSILDLS